MIETAHHYTTFAIRRDESIRFLKGTPSYHVAGYRYVVMLRDVPPVPSIKKGKRPLTVVCAQFGPSGWKLINLESITKQLIEQHLLRTKTPINKWVFMEVLRHREFVTL